MLTGSSRTDAGVHATQNYFHFDTETPPSTADAAKAVYHLNAILPPDISISSIREVKENAHCRFDAISRTYIYTVYTKKDPFMDDRGYYCPFTLDTGLLGSAAEMIKSYTDFTSFSKKNTQAFTNLCTVNESRWAFEENRLFYTVTANRFLRGMVRGLTGTMLLVARGKYSLEHFRNMIESKDASATDFSVPGKGLILRRVLYPENIFL